MSIPWKYSGGGKDLYKSEEAREIAHGSYDRAMELWEGPYGEEWIPTSYGKTHLIVAGPPEGEPLFLLPGLWGDATMWYPNGGPLSGRFRVYAPDMITYAGKSEPSGQSVKDVSDYAAWFLEIMEHLGLEKASVVGVSYSSWLSLALAREIPQSLTALVLLDPASTFIKMDGGIAWRGFWAFGFFPNRNKYRDFFRWIGGGYSDPASSVWEEHMFDVVEQSAVGMFDIPQPVIYRKEDLEEVGMPVLIMVGSKPILYKSPEEFLKAAKKALPHSEIEMVDDTGHGLNMEKADYVNERITEFMGRTKGGIQ